MPSTGHVARAQKRRLQALRGQPTGPIFDSVAASLKNKSVHRKPTEVLDPRVLSAKELAALRRALVKWQTRPRN